MSPALRETLAPMRRPCGALRLTVMGETCVLRCSGALWLPDHGALVAGDLHLEKASAFAVRGQMLPPYDSRATLDRLAVEIAELDPGVVILLGDSFHDSRAIGRMAGGDRDRLDLLARGRDWLWVEGNHDRRALEQADVAALARLPGRVVGHLSVGGLTLTHEPSPAPRPGEVAGHLHPAVRIVGHGRSVRRPCFVTDGRRLLLPAFGAFTGGLNVRDPAVAGLFETPPLIAALGRDRVHAVAWDKAAPGR